MKKAKCTLNVLSLVWLLLSLTRAAAAQGGARPAQDAGNYPQPTQGDYVVRDFKFRSGETLPELRLHYATLGTPARDAGGVVRNAVLVMHGTGGTGGQFLTPQFAGV